MRPTSGSTPPYGSPAPAPHLESSAQPLRQNWDQKSPINQWYFPVLRTGMRPMIFTNAQRNIIRASASQPTQSQNRCFMDYLHTYLNVSPTAAYAHMILKSHPTPLTSSNRKRTARAAAHYHLGWHNQSPQRRCRRPMQDHQKTSFPRPQRPRQANLHGRTTLVLRNCPRGTRAPTASQRHPVRDRQQHSTRHSEPKMRQKLSKSFDMRYWWMKDRIKQKYSILSKPPKT
jgi:hypothetical protein